MPVRTGSIAELNLITERPATVQQVNDCFRQAAAAAPLKGVMGVLEDEWASSRIVGDPLSSIIDLPLTHGAGGHAVRWRPGTTTRWATPRAWPRRRRSWRGSKARFSAHAHVRRFVRKRHVRRAGAHVRVRTKGMSLGLLLVQYSKYAAE